LTTSYDPSYKQEGELGEKSQVLEMSHNHLLISASLIVAMMAGFTGLSVMQGASGLNLVARKRAVIMAAIAMGTGIWSMHFVAMLGMKLPVPFFYDALITLASALVAILVVGIALLIMHFIPRTVQTKTIAGVIVGSGILAMHYLGMYGIRLVHPIYSGIGIIVAIATSIILSTSMIFIAYNERENKNIIAGTVLFGIAVFMVHFVAMAGTEFEEMSNAPVPDLRMSNEVLALGVALASFVISGAFLLMSVSLLPSNFKADLIEEAITDSFVSEKATDVIAVNPTEPDEKNWVQIPYERNNQTHFIKIEDIAAIRAEGHYTILYSVDEKHFCPWNISEMKKRLTGEGFLQTHRSYLVNPRHISSFERTKDNGYLLFSKFKSFEKVPVSRSKLNEIRKELDLS
jgi:NO-binding membrane sensor protein with MHYT domain